MSEVAEILAGRYRLDDPIAAGPVGEVWRGVDLVLKRPVAVKLLRLEYGLDEDTMARFRAEARHSGSLSHPAITRVYDFGEAEQGNPPYLVMELVEGESLARMWRTGRLSLAASPTSSGRPPRGCRRHTRPGSCTAISSRPRTC